MSVLGNHGRPHSARSRRRRRGPGCHLLMSWDACSQRRRDRCNPAAAHTRGAIDHGVADSLVSEAAPQGSVRSSVSEPRSANARSSLSSVFGAAGEGIGIGSSCVVNGVVGRVPVGALVVSSIWKERRGAPARRSAKKRSAGPSRAWRFVWGRASSLPSSPQTAMKASIHSRTVVSICSGDAAAWLSCARPSRSRVEVTRACRDRFALSVQIRTTRTPVRSASEVIPSRV